MVARPTAHLRLPGNGCCVAADCLGNAKVDEFQLALHEQEVCWLEVAVHNALLMNTSNSLQGTKQQPVAAAHAM